ncbi:MAG: argininosuccinate lyase [Myxococcota bacterium]
MVRPLWDKGQSSVDEAVQRFCAADDVALDRMLFLHDVRASRAHVRGLERIGVLNGAECSSLVSALEELEQLFTDGKFILDERYEDGHTAIEHFLTEKLGETGRKVHTGRSRNDQVLVAQRLYVRSALDALSGHELEAARVCLRRAREEMRTPMPGYTHLQRAVPSSVGAWFAAFAEAFVDDAVFCRAVRDLLDASPLGTAAGYGVNLPLDRQGVARELEFSRVVVSPIHAQNSRGKLERAALEALHQALLDVRRLAWDLSLFSTAEFAFVRLPDAYTTGSSLMPNKRNPDVVELLRQLPAVTSGALAELDATLSLPSGYHRDLQGTKGPVLRALSRGLAGMALVPALLGELRFNDEGMRAAISSDMYATDRAIELAREGVPFRDAYRRAAAEIGSGAPRAPESSLGARVSLGGMAEPGLDLVEERLRALSRSTE